MILSVCDLQASGASSPAGSVNVDTPPSACTHTPCTPGTYMCALGRGRDS